MPGRVRRDLANLLEYFVKSLYACTFSGPGRVLNRDNTHRVA